MTLREILRAADYEKTMKELGDSNCAWDSEESYKHAWEELVSLESRPNEDGLYKIIVIEKQAPVGDEYDKVSFAYAVSNKDDDRYGLDLADWRHFIDLPVETDLPLERACAILLWELTFDGFSLSAVLASIKKIEERIVSSVSEEDFITLDELLRQIGSQGS